MMSGGYTGNWRISAIAPSARQVVGQRPTPEVYADRLVRVLEEAATEAPEGTENRSKLRALAEAVAGAGREIMVDVAARVISSSMGASLTATWVEDNHLARCCRDDVVFCNVTIDHPCGSTGGR